MAKKDDAPEMAVCDACGREMPAADLSIPDERGMAYCATCAERRADDPMVVVQGRALTASELVMQAEDDEHLAAALDGDTVQDQLRAGRGKR